MLSHLALWRIAAMFFVMGVLVRKGALMSLPPLQNNRPNVKKTDHCPVY